MAIRFVPHRSPLDGPHRCLRCSLPSRHDPGRFEGMISAFRHPCGQDKTTHPSTCSNRANLPPIQNPTATSRPHSVSLPMDEQRATQAMDWAPHMQRERPVNCLVEPRPSPWRLKPRKTAPRSPMPTMPATKSSCRTSQPRAGPSSAKKACRTPLSERKLGTVVAGRPPRRHQLLYSDAPGYAVNIALMEHDGKEWVPILGVVALPDLNSLLSAATAWAYSRTSCPDPTSHPANIRADDDATPPSNC